MMQPERPKYLKQSYISTNKTVKTCTPDQSKSRNSSKSKTPFFIKKTFTNPSLSKFNTSSITKQQP